MPPRQGAPRAGGGPCTGLRFCPPAFLALTRVTVDELPRLVAPCEAALPAQKACCDALHHCRMHLIRWPLRVHALIGFQGLMLPLASEKRNSFLRLLKNKAFKKERRTKNGVYAIGECTTLESNKSLDFIGKTL